MSFEQELSKKMFIVSGEVKKWNLKELSKWVISNKNYKPPDSWIEDMNRFFKDNHICVRLVYLDELEFCVIYTK